MEAKICLFMGQQRNELLFLGATGAPNHHIGADRRCYTASEIQSQPSPAAGNVLAKSSEILVLKILEYLVIDIL